MSSLGVSDAHARLQRNARVLVRAAQKAKDAGELTADEADFVQIATEIAEGADGSLFEDRLAKWIEKGGYLAARARVMLELQRTTVEVAVALNNGSSAEEGRLRWIYGDLLGAYYRSWRTPGGVVWRVILSEKPEKLAKLEKLRPTSAEVFFEKLCLAWEEHFLYAPGGEGFEEAAEHFKTLASK